MAKPVVREPKKPYSSPIITLYGTVKELTRGKLGSHGNDGGKKPLNRTRF
jgi:hypothetical protein